MHDVADVEITDAWACASLEALQRTTDLARRVLNAPVSFVSSLTSDQYILRATSGLEHLAGALPVSGDVDRRVFETRCPLVVPDVALDPSCAALPRQIAAFVAAPLRLGPGRDIGTLCVIDLRPHAWTHDDLDILTQLAASLTNQIDLKLEVMAAHEAAETARVAKDAVVVNVNHELRTPLQAIIGFTDFLKTETHPELIVAHAANIQAAAQSLLAVVNQSLSRAESGAQSGASELVDLWTFGETCLSMVGPACVAKNLSSRFEMDAGVPARVTLDGQAIKQALVNLLNNAVKFTDQGSLTLRVTRAAARLRFSVSDTGIGIPEDRRDLLFQRFSRVGPTDRPSEGSGLGLSITKGLVEGLGGRIGFDTHADRGTTFWFEIPLTDDGALPSPLAEEAPGTPFASDAAGARILLADDLDLNRKLIADMLGTDGHLVDCVTDGAEAVKAASERSYDIILMDMIMPGMDGIAATRAIRKLPAPACDVPILALTANSFKEQLDSCLKAGMDATLTKPMSLDALTSAVASWTRGRNKAA